MLAVFDTLGSVLCYVLCTRL